MTEFLTGNARLAYPLEHEWPAAADEKWLRVMLDASIGYDGMPKTRVSVLKARCDKAGHRLVLRIGISDTDCIDVALPSGKKNLSTLYAHADTGAGSKYKILLAFDGTVVDAILADTKITSSSWFSVGVPFSLRCVSYANNRVTDISAYAPTRCTTPVFSEEARTAVRTVSGETDVIFGAKDGIDLEVAEMEPIDGELLRVSAVTAPADTPKRDNGVDMLVRGDECFSVTTLPGTYVNDEGDIAKYNDTGSPYAELGEFSCGVVLIKTKCKPCCQCEDYQDATNALRPADTSVKDIKEMLDDAKEVYDAAVEAFEELKKNAEKAVASYTNIRVSATSAASGGIYSGSSASGSRSRISVTLIVSNMTQERAIITSVAFSVPGYTMIRSQWSRAGVTTITGDSLDVIPLAELSSGDSLTVVVTMAKTSTTNEAEKPAGMTASVVAALPARADMPERETQKTITVAVT